MVVGVAFCPHPPVLLPELARGAAGELDEVRSACRAAIRTAAGTAVQVVLVGSGPVSQRHGAGAVGSLAGFGADVRVALGAAAPMGEPVLPLSLTVGAW